MSIAARGELQACRAPWPWDPPSPGGRGPVQMLPYPSGHRSFSRGLDLLHPHHTPAVHFCPVPLFNTCQEKGSKCQDNLGFKLLGLNILKGTHPPAQS